MSYVCRTNIDASQFDCVVSIGNKCPTAMTLRDLNIYAESFPFDSVPTTPKLILKYLKDQTDFFPDKGTVRNKDDVWFGHFNIHDGYDETVTTLKRRFERLFELFKTNKRVLFVYSSEADVYNEMGNRYNNNYGAICEIRDYLKDECAYSNFTIAAIHVNKDFPDSDQILNYTITVNEACLSDDMSTHVPSVCELYRDCLKRLMVDIFQLPPPVR